MRRIALTLLTAISLLVILSASQMVLAWEALDSPAPPDGKFIVFDNFDMNIETSRWFFYGDLEHVFASTAQDAWYEPRAKTNGASGCWYSTYAQHPNQACVTYRAWSNHNGWGVGGIGDWAIAQVLYRGEEAWAFGIAFFPWEYNDRAHAFIAKSAGYGYGSMYLDIPLWIGPGCQEWHYYRIICGYKEFADGWHSYVWWYVGNTAGTWWYSGEHDCTTDSFMHFGYRQSGTGICDYPNKLYIGWHNYLGLLTASPWIGVDFAARANGWGNPFP